MTTVSTLFTLIQHSPRILSQSNKTGIQIGKKKVTLSLIADGMILYLKDPENSTKNS
jgi:hypothetical protein